VPCGTLTVSCMAIPLAMIILTSLACVKTVCVACHAFKWNGAFHQALLDLARMSSILACCIFVDLICFLLDLASVGSILGDCMFLIFILSVFVILASVGSIPGWCTMLNFILNFIFLHIAMLFVHYKKIVEMSNLIQKKNSHSCLDL
jgi:hypothetical protein